MACFHLVKVFVSILRYPRYFYSCLWEASREFSASYHSSMHLSQVHALPWPLLFCPVSYAIFICFLCSIFCVFDTHLAVTSQSPHWCHGKLATAPQSFVKVGKSNSKSEVARGQSREKGLPTPSALPLLSPPRPPSLSSYAAQNGLGSRSPPHELSKWRGKAVSPWPTDEAMTTTANVDHCNTECSRLWFGGGGRAGGGRSAGGGARAGGGMGRTDGRRGAIRSKVTLRLPPPLSPPLLFLRSGKLQHLEVSCTLETYRHARARKAASENLRWIPIGRLLCWRALSGPSFRPSRTASRTRPRRRRRRQSLSDHRSGDRALCLAGRRSTLPCAMPWEGGRARERTLS